MRLIIIVFMLLLSVTSVEARQNDGAPSSTTPTPETLSDDADAPAEWEFSLSASFYIIDEDDDYIQTTFTADHDWLHLEVRHQYEDLDTVSIWLGYNFSFGDKLTVDFTPMIGGVFGDTDGVAPGYEITLAWRQLELYTEGEFVFDAHDSGDNFFYAWTELTWSATDWLRFGAAMQRTKIREERTDYEFGPMVGLTWNALDFSAYLLYPEEGDPTIMLALEFGF